MLRIATLSEIAVTRRRNLGRDRGETFYRQRRPPSALNRRFVARQAALRAAN